jgi:K319L-like, PKD domain
MVTRTLYTLYDVILVTSFIVLLLGCSNGGDNNSSGDGDSNSPGDAVTLSTPNSYLKFFNQYDDPGLGAVVYAQAYYAVIDPGNKRDTLNKFISHHQNDGSDWIHVIFRDTLDLGYGRDMYMRAHSNDNGCPEIAFYVRNFVVAPVPGFDYGPLNLEAAIKNDTHFHFATNAIEVSRADDDINCTGPRFLKFFTYVPTGERSLFIDFDGRGVKAMPQVCVSCHGGTLRPLDGNPALLAAFIAPLVSDFNTKYVNADGSIKRPGSPIAQAGLDRLVPPNTPITLNGGSSLFASQFRWEVVTRPNNSNPTLAQATSLTPVFTTDTVGTYELSLTVSNDSGMSHTDMVTLKVDARATDSSLVRFADVKRILQRDCVFCHAAGGIAGIPVWFTDMQSASSSLSLYQQVRAKVNLADVPHSLLLTKPSGLHHFGGQLAGFDISSPVGSPARENYDLFVNWIYAGAPE